MGSYFQEAISTWTTPLFRLAVCFFFILTSVDLSLKDNKLKTVKCTTNLVFQINWDGYEIAISRLQLLEKVGWLNILQPFVVVRNCTLYHVTFSQSWCKEIRNNNLMFQFFFTRSAIFFWLRHSQDAQVTCGEDFKPRFRGEKWKKKVCMLVVCQKKGFSAVFLPA